MIIYVVLEEVWTRTLKLVNCLIVIAGYDSGTQTWPKCGRSHRIRLD